MVSLRDIQSIASPKEFALDFQLKNMSAHTPQGTALPFYGPTGQPSYTHTVPSFASPFLDTSYHDFSTPAQPAFPDFTPALSHHSSFESPIEDELALMATPAAGAMPLFDLENDGAWGWEGPLFPEEEVVKTDPAAEAFCMPPQALMAAPPSTMAAPALPPPVVVVEQPQEEVFVKPEVISPLMTTKPSFTPASRPSLKRDSTSTSSAPSSPSPSMELEDSKFDLPSYKRRRTAELPPLPVDSLDPIEAKRAKNTEAARRSRQRKLEKIEGLEGTIRDLRAEVEMWRARAIGLGWNE
ncbi:hypothetical protein YB2330_006028 [Saitoella coloradoensis]